MTCDRNEGVYHRIFILFFNFFKFLIQHSHREKVKKYQKGRFINDIIPDVEDALSGKL
jgi:hypothetical protein